MLYRVLAAMAPMTCAALVWSGAIPVYSLVRADAYSKEVDAPVSSVSAALGALDFDTLAGNESGPYRAIPAIRRERTPDGYAWHLMSGNRVAMDMEVTLTPIRGGGATRVDAHVSGGGNSDPNDLPAGLRAPGAVNVMFAAALDAELNPFAPPAERLSPAELEAKRRQARGLAVEMDETDRERAETVPGLPPPAHDGISFEPGKPMVDTRR